MRPVWPNERRGRTGRERRTSGSSVVAIVGCEKASDQGRPDQVAKRAEAFKEIPNNLKSSPGF
jgi:hypothetical protein